MIVLFAEASTNQIKIVLNCLQVFEEMSRHKVSSEKTYIYFSPNVRPELKRDICNASRFKEVDKLGRYLGATILFPKRRKDQYKTIVERVKQRLDGWQAQCLSLVGRMTLVKSVTNTMAQFPMQHNRIP